MLVSDFTGDLLTTFVFVFFGNIDLTVEKTLTHELAFFFFKHALC